MRTTSPQLTTTAITIGRQQTLQSSTYSWLSSDVSTKTSISSQQLGHCTKTPCTCCTTWFSKGEGSRLRRFVAIVQLQLRLKTRAFRSPIADKLTCKAPTRVSFGEVGVLPNSFAVIRMYLCGCGYVSASAGAARFRGLPTQARRSCWLVPA